MTSLRASYQGGVIDDREIGNVARKPTLSSSHSADMQSSQSKTLLSRQSGRPGFRDECRIQSILVIIGGILVHLSLGSIYTFGNISPYLISYLRARTSDTSLRNVDALWVMNIAALTSGLATTCGGVLDKRFGPRIATGFGCAVYCGSVALTYFSVKNSLVAVMFSYGLFANFGLSCAYGPPAQAAAKWFPSHPSVAIGMILMGFGGGAVIFNQVITLYINPNNLSPDLTTDDGEKYFTEPSLLDRVPNIFLVLAGCFAGLSCLGLIFIRAPPIITTKDAENNTNTTQNSLKATVGNRYAINDSGILKLVDEDDSLMAIKQRETVRPSVKQVLKTMLTNKNSWILWAMVFFINAGMQYIVTLYKAYGQTFISDDHFLALVGSMSAIFNCVFRPMWGYSLDRFGFQITVKSIAAGFVCLVCTLLFTENLGKGFFLVWVGAMYAFFCGIWPLGPATLAKLFGTENMALNMGLTMFAAGMSTTMGGLTGIALRDIIGWHGLYLVSGFLGACAFFLSFFFNGRTKEGIEI